MPSEMMAFFYYKYQCLILKSRMQKGSGTKVEPIVVFCEILAQNSRIYYAKYSPTLSAAIFTNAKIAILSSFRIFYSP